VAQSQLISLDPNDTIEVTAFKLGIGSASSECPSHGFHERDFRSVTMITREYESVTFMIPMSLWEIFKNAINDIDDVDT